MKQYYITLGQGHEHRILGTVLDKDTVLMIEAPNEQEARKKAFEILGDNWHQCILSSQAEGRERSFLSYFPNGTIEYKRIVIEYETRLLVETIVSQSNDNPEMANSILGASIIMQAHKIKNLL